MADAFFKKDILYFFIIILTNQNSLKIKEGQKGNHGEDCSKLLNNKIKSLKFISL